MGIYKDNIVKGCVRREGKLICYAYDLSSLPPGSEDPEMATKKCIIVFDGATPEFRVTGGAENLCYDILKDLGNLLKKSKDIGLSFSSITKAYQKLEQRKLESE